MERILLGATTPGQNGPGNDGIEEYSAFPKAPALLDGLFPRSTETTLFSQPG